MNTKSRKKHKTPDYSLPRPNNGEAEVFVLPPNLLEKLGIKLDNIATHETFPTDRKSSRELADRTVLSSHKNVEQYFGNIRPVNNKNESSILETASLMKESVFLSPTFVPTVANAIPGEVEIARPCDHQFDTSGENQIRSTISFPAQTSSKQHNSLHNNVELIKRVEVSPITNKINDSDQHKFGTTVKDGDSIKIMKAAIGDLPPKKNTIHKKCEIDSSDNTTLINAGTHLGSNKVSAIKNCKQALELTKIDVVKTESKHEKAVDSVKKSSCESLNQIHNNNNLTSLSMDIISPTADDTNDIHSINCMEKSKESEKVLSLLHDIGRPDADVRPSEITCDFVVNEFVEPIDISCFDNKVYMLNNVNDDSMIDNHNIEVGNNPSEVDKVFSDHIYNADKEDNGNKEGLTLDDKCTHESLPRTLNDITTDSNLMDIPDDVCALSVKDMNHIGNNELINLSELELGSQLHGNDEMMKSSMCKAHIEWNRINEEIQYPIDHISLEKDDISTVALSCDNNEYKINNTNSLVRKSKLCIQGVEKPGGNTQPTITCKNVLSPDQNIRDQKKPTSEVGSTLSDSELNGGEIKIRVLKTYKREKTNIKQFDKNFNHSVKNVCDLDKKIDNEDAVMNLNDLSKIHDFCLCGDFGQLKYYDHDTSYEHIHFWEHKIATADRDLLFSIYNVDPLSNYDIVEGTEKDVTEESTEELGNKICWSDMSIDDKITSSIVDYCDETNYKENTDGVTLSNKTSVELNDEKLNCELANIVTPNTNEKNTIEVETKTVGGDEGSDNISNTCTDLTEPSPPLSSTTAESVEVNVGDDLETNSKTESDNPNKIVKKRGRKRKSSIAKCESSLIMEEPRSKRDVKCGVCGRILSRSQWEQHSAKEHGYIAWRDGETIDLGNKELRRKVREKLRMEGVLKCIFCDSQVKVLKHYMDHVEECLGEKLNEDNNKPSGGRRSLTSGNKESAAYVPAGDVVNCGVCKQDVPNSDWMLHICQQHNYLAWKSGDDPLDLDDTDAVEKHLSSFIKIHGPIICSNCGFDRKYRRKNVKTYIEHVKTCNKTEDNVEKVVEPEDVVEAVIEQTAMPRVPRAESGSVACGVCGQEVADAAWADHIGKEHNYLAWKQGENSIDLEDDEQVWKHLYALTKQYNGLICSKCGIKRKYVKKYLSHIKECDGTVSTNESLLTSTLNESQFTDLDSSVVEQKIKIEKIKCGVCSKKIIIDDWFNHIGRKHNYIAWKRGETPLDTNDEEAVEDHLYNIMKEQGHLSCSQCGLEHKFEVDTVQTYLSHVGTCDKSVDSEDEIDPTDPSAGNIVKCAVCEKTLKESRWIKHIERKHSYVAWKDGETPLDQDDDEAIRQYLFTLLDQIDAFKCAKCGVEKKYPKSFITHIKACKASVNDNMNDDYGPSGDMCECAVCNEKVPLKKWSDHAMKYHYNIAWKVGDFPIDLKSTYGAEKYLKEYKLRKGKLVCKKCGISRVSMAGFYAHILTCGKSEEELEPYKNVCEVCNNKYLCIYKNQHMAFHREQEYAKERKIKESELSKEQKEQQSAPTGRRKAALRASSVIEKINSTSEFSHTCATCGFDTDSERKMARHRCGAAVAYDDESSSSESDLPSEHSGDMSLTDEEGHETVRKRKNKESMVQAKVPNVPFKYKDVNSYTAQSKEDFYKVHYTSETLFPHWLSSEYELLSDQQISEYLPPMENSCKIMLNNEWSTFTRYEARTSVKGFTMFVGASIQCMSWAPPHVECDERDGNYLAVSCHRGDDIPRLNYDELAAHAGLIQIWDFGNFQKHHPKFVLGIAHDYGTIWAMDWCPSGAREVNSEETRLGLLAVACSNGFAYVFCVPFPSTISESCNYIKLKPVAMLKLLMGSNRTLYQATAITWSKQRGHAVVGVGYADGTTAYYDLSNASPLLQGSEGGLTVYYPYHDEREHNVCVTAMDTFASEAEAWGGGASASASLGGVAAALRPAAARARLRAHSSASGCCYTPGWPSLLVAIDDAISSQGPNEMEWYGCSRRLGPMRACCGCRRCGRVLLHAPPLLRTVRALPPYAELRKQNIMGIRAVSLRKKRQRDNDELSMQIEPLTYQEVISQYGIEIFFVEVGDKNNSLNTVKEYWSERFPLADVSALAFCPAEAHHHRAAAALHAGFVLLFTV